MARSPRSLAPYGQPLRSETARGAPAVIVGLGLLYLLFSVGFTAMSRHVKNAGAFYAYIVNGLGRPMDVVSAFTAIVGYGALQLCPARDDGLLPQSGAAGLLQCPSVVVGECADYLRNHPVRWLQEYRG